MDAPGGLPRRHLHLKDGHLVLWDPAVGGDVAGLHALPGPGQPGGHAAGDERGPPGAAELLPGAAVRADVPVLAPYTRGAAQLPHNLGASRLLPTGLATSAFSPYVGACSLILNKSSGDLAKC